MLNFTVMVVTVEGNISTTLEGGGSVTLTASNCAKPILPRQSGITDEGYGGCGNGWYDVQYQGVPNDYCRWVGNCGCRGSCSFWSCALADR
eukprot:UN05701